MDRPNDKLLNLVAALALLDTDFRQYQGPGATKQSDDTAGAWSGLHGRRWSRQVLWNMWGVKVGSEGEKKRADRELAKEEEEVLGKAEELLDFVQPSELLDELLVAQQTTGDSREQRLFCRFLATVLEAVTKSTAGDHADQAAGAIYLYNALFHELVMVASHGFPLVLPKDGKSPLKELVSGGEEASETKPTGTDQERKEQKAKVVLALNVRRLRYCKMLQEKLMKRRAGRDDWTKQSWKASFTKENWKDGRSELHSRDHEQCPIDCNRVLPGVAYYSPGKGITGQIFDKKAGPDLERILLTEKRDEVKAGWVAKVEGNPLADGDPECIFSQAESFFLDEILLKRTVGYKQRNEMASGRQVVAGTYEALQFPHSDFIGPFLGCVLRFGGEHFGVLKVELHRFNGKLSSGSLGFPTDYVLELDADHDFFTPEAIADFLLVAYALAGVLYLLKHHYGLDLMEAFRLSWPEWKKKEGQN